MSMEGSGEGGVYLHKAFYKAHNLLYMSTICVSSGVFRKVGFSSIQSECSTQSKESPGPVTQIGSDLEHPALPTSYVSQERERIGGEGGHAPPYIGLTSSYRN